MSSGGPTGPGIGAGTGGQAGGPAPTRSGSGSGIGASTGASTPDPQTRVFPSDAAWNALQVAWFHDSPVALWQTMRTRTAIRKLTGATA